MITSFNTFPSLSTQKAEWGCTVEISRWIAPLPTKPILTSEFITAAGHKVRMDPVDDFIPFWLQGIKAAALGEEPLKMSDFLDELERRQRWENVDRRRLSSNRHGNCRSETPRRRCLEEVAVKKKKMSAPWGVNFGRKDC